LATTYFVCPMDTHASQSESDFYHVSQTELEGALHARWPDVEVILAADPRSGVSCYWTMDLGRGPFDCRLSLGRECLWLEDGDAADHATMAIWFRRLVPAQYRLSFFNPDGYPRQFELTTDTTEEDVIRFRAGPSRP
jgi:hypothetical protein